MTCVAVIDLETTGLNPYRHDRIVELAALAIRPDGTVLRAFNTLINPERDIGPTRLHGLDTRDILAAPRFGEIAGALLEVLDGCVALAGHNIRFDHSFLTVVFVNGKRAHLIIENGPTWGIKGSAVIIENEPI